MKPFNEFLNEAETAAPTPATADQSIVEKAKTPTEPATSAVPHSKDASPFAEEMNATLVRTIKELWA